MYLPTVNTLTSFSNHEDRAEVDAATEGLCVDRDRKAGLLLMIPFDLQRFLEGCCIACHSVIPSMNGFCLMSHVVTRLFF